MVIKFFYIFITCFLLVFMFVVMKNPYSLDWKPSDSAIANIEIDDVEDYEISKDGILGHTQTKKVIRYKDRDEFFSIDSKIKKDGAINFLKANKGILKDNVFYFSGNVDYERENEIFFQSELLEYHLKERNLIGRALFNGRNKNTNVQGEYFIYSILNNTIDIDKIKTIIKMDQK